MNRETQVAPPPWKILERQAAMQIACQYIPKHFRPSRKRNTRSIYSLKHDFERAAEYYINEADYTECLRQCGLKVVDGRVFAKDGDYDEPTRSS